MPKEELHSYRLSDKLLMIKYVKRGASLLMFELKVIADENCQKRSFTPNVWVKNNCWKMCQKRSFTPTDWDKIKKLIFWLLSNSKLFFEKQK